MKRIIFLSIFFFSIKTFSQDTAKLVARIDSIVDLYNHSNFETKQDSSSNTAMNGDFTNKVWETVLRDGGKVKKYIHIVDMSMKMNNNVKQSKTHNIFYFDDDHLIKVEEGMTSTEGNADMSWYFNKDGLIHHGTHSSRESFTLTKEKIDERGKFLATLAQTILQKLTP